MRVLVVNAGSSSLKVRLLGDGDEVLADSDSLEGMPVPNAPLSVSFAFFEHSGGIGLGRGAAGTTSRVSQTFRYSRKSGVFGKPSPGLPG